MYCTRRFLLIAVMLMMVSMLTAQPPQRGAFRNVMRETDPAFFTTSEARRIGDQMLIYQRVTGGWPKNIDMTRRLTDQELQRVLADKQRTDDSTIDNDATTTQMIYLARLYQQTGDERYSKAFCDGLNFLLSGQFEDGGWPQFWPNPHGYQVHITYNDNNISNTLGMFQQIIAQHEPYQGSLTDDAMRQRLQASFDKGIDNILQTQIQVKGKPTVWCQQHYHDTYAPAPARAFELPSYCTAESAGLVRLLMSLPNPDKRVKAAVHGAMKWFDTYKLTGLRIERTGSRDDLQHQDTRLVKDPGADHPIWARFYDLERTEPFVCDRDGIARRHLSDIGYERRNGYGWYNESPAPLFALYDAWADQYDPKHKVKISLTGKGANETGRIDMDRRPVHDLKDYDAVVRPGESIQQALEKAPADTSLTYKVFVCKGTYEQKVIIDRPNVILVGEDRDSTIIVLAETAQTLAVSEYNGKPVRNGVIVIQEGADNCIISGLTVYNNYGTAVDPGNTMHQMAIFGKATRTIVINCNVWADGNDALSLWCENGGMYYHADLNLRCPGVDFLCPRGWCYATRCHFYGDGRAIIWHDGRSDKSQKLVITNSSFDAKSPTKLGRWHHDSQFYLVNCRLSSNILDSNIQYAYSDKVVDPCPWGQRVYYLNCSREGGHSGWLKDNIQESGEELYYYSTTATWTFGRKWDPEQRIRDFWKWLAY